MNDMGLYERIIQEGVRTPPRSDTSKQERMIRTLLRRGVNSPHTGMWLKALEKKAPAAFQRIYREERGQKTLF